MDSDSPYVFLFAAETRIRVKSSCVRQVAYIAPGTQNPILLVVIKDIQAGIPEIETARGLKGNAQCSPENSVKNAPMCNNHH